MPVAETLGVVSGIIAIVQISKTIISLCQFYIEVLEGTPSDLRVILIEVSTLKGIAESLQYLTQDDVSDSALLTQLAAVTGPIEGCKKALEDLKALFPPDAVFTNGQRSKRRKLNDTVALLAWPLKIGKSKKLLQEIVQHKTTLNLALTAEFVHDLKSVKHKTEQIQNLLTESQQANIYKWLETTNPSDIHNRSQRLYEDGTASWVLKTPEWSVWIKGKHRCLWISGIPGAGKTILASYLAEEIERRCTSSSSESLKLDHMYYYCYFGHNQDESTHFLRWVIGQLCRQSSRIPQEVLDMYESGKSPTLSQLLSALCSTLEVFERAYVVLDAVDESLPRADLLRVIRDLSQDARFSALGLIVTSRQYIDIEQIMGSCSMPVPMTNQFVEDDIRALVHSTIQKDARYQKWPEDLKREMQDTVPKKAEGMFRWAVCQIDILRRLKPDISIIRAALSNLPRTLDETYERILLEIPEDDWLPVQHVLHWLMFHNELFKTEMSLNTLLQAMQYNSASSSRHYPDLIHDLEGLRERCGCLIMVQQEPEMQNGVSEVLRPERQMVLFAHYTVKEYLQSSRISQKRVGFFALAQEKIQKQFAEIALRQALDIQPDDDIWNENGRPRSIFKVLNADFKSYCGVFAILQIFVWPKVISSDLTLMGLSEALVDPHAPSRRGLEILLSKTDHADYFFHRPDVTEYNRFWEIDWKEKPDSNSAIFLSFLVSAHEIIQYSLFPRREPYDLDEDERAKIEKLSLDFGPVEIGPDGQNPEHNDASDLSENSECAGNRMTISYLME
ncbi:MAG: hypothetical protein Q9160_007955 [Pyrenula sp. 1 TL-2023]